MAAFSALPLSCPAPGDRQSSGDWYLLEGGLLFRRVGRQKRKRGWAASLTGRHELPQLLRHDDALLCLVVLQDGADGAGGGTHCSVEHMDKLHLVHHLLGLPISDSEPASLIVCAVRTGD